MRLRQLVYGVDEIDPGEIPKSVVGRKDANHFFFFARGESRMGETAVMLLEALGTLLAGLAMAWTVGLSYRAKTK